MQGEIGRCREIWGEIWRGVAFGFITYVGILRPSLAFALCKSFQMVDLPHPLGPTTTTPMRCWHASWNCITLRICSGSASSFSSASTSRTVRVRARATARAGG